MEGEEEKRLKEKEEIRALSELMEPEIHQFDSASLPVPEGVPEEVVHAVKSPEVDSNFYPYARLADKVHNMPPIPKITLGFESLDMLLEGGAHRGELMIVSAMTKSGKTEWCQNMTFLQASKGIRCLWFSLEMSWIEITRKFMGIDSSYLVSKIPQDLPIYYSMNNANFNVGKLRERVVEAQKQFGVDVVYVDHLHFLVSMEEAGKGNVSFLIGSIVRSIKRMAVELNIFVVLIAHTKKIELTVAPDLNSLRDSSFLAQEADFVLMLWRQRLETSKKEKNGSSKNEDSDEDEDSADLYTGKTFVSMEANRRGPNKRFVFGFLEGRFYPWREYLQKKEVQEFFSEKKVKFEQKNPYVAASSVYQSKEKLAKKKIEEEAAVRIQQEKERREEESRLAQTKLLKEDEDLQKGTHLELLEDIF